VQKKNKKIILDTRDLKILSVKKEELKDSLVFIIGGNKTDRSSLMKMAEHLQEMEPNSIYFPVSSEIDIQIYDMNDLKHRDILVSVNKSDNTNNNKIESEVKKALSKAKSVTFVYGDMNIKRK